jgi:tetratricopeptide (TPR) repeat protein
MAYTNRGSVYLKLDQLELALRDYDKAIQLNTQIVEAYVGRAIVYALLGNDIEARRNADWAVELGHDPTR